MKKSKTLHRLFSVFSLGVFLLSLFFVGFVGWSLFQTYQEQQQLEKEKKRLEEEKEYIKTVEDLLEDGFYTVYFDGGYVLVDSNGNETIIFIVK